MRKSGLVAGLLAVFLIAAPFQAKVCLAQLGNYNYQNIIVDTSLNFLGFEQGSGGWNFMDIGSTSGATLNLSNSSIYGIYNLDAGAGSVRNQASIIMVNIDPLNTLPPLTVSGLMTLANNQPIISDFNYSSTLIANGLQGSGILALNLNVGSFNNQFTSVAVYLGRVSPTPTSPPIVSLGTGDVNLVALTKSQLQAVAATSNNDIILQGKQQASALIQGDAFKNFSGLAAVTNVAGVGNQVMNNMQVTISAGK